MVFHIVGKPSLQTWLIYAKSSFVVYVYIDCCSDAVASSLECLATSLQLLKCRTPNYVVALQSVLSSMAYCFVVEEHSQGFIASVPFSRENNFDPSYGFLKIYHYFKFETMFFNLG